MNSADRFRSVKKSPLAGSSLLKTREQSSNFIMPKSTNQKASSGKGSKDKSHKRSAFNQFEFTNLTQQSFFKHSPQIRKSVEFAIQDPIIHKGVNTSQNWMSKFENIRSKNTKQHHEDSINKCKLIKT